MQACGMTARLYVKSPGLRTRYIGAAGGRLFKAEKASVAVTTAISKA